MKYFSIKYIRAILIFYIFWLFLFPFFLTKAIPLICENISYNSAFIVQIKNPKIRFNIIPTAIIKAEEVNIRSKTNSQNITIKNPYMNLRILPLLSGHVHFNKIYALDLDANTKLKKQISLDKDFLSKISSAKFNCKEFRLENFNVAVFQPNVSQPAVFSGKDIYFKKNNRYIKLNMDCKTNVQNKQSNIYANLYLPQNNDINKSVINVKVSNLDSAPIGEYLKNYLPEDVVGIKGIVDVYVNKDNLHIALKNFACDMKDSAKSVIFPKEFVINSGFNITRKRIQIDNADIKSDRINVNLNGNINDYLDKQLPSYSFNVRINPSKIEDFIDLLPPFKTEDMDVYKLKKYKFYGDIIGNLSIKGKNLEPSVNGNIYVNNGILTRPIPNAKGATIKLNFIGKYLNFDVFVPAGAGENVKVKGGVELYNVKYSDMRIWSTKNVNLQTAEDKVVPLHEILNFVIGPVPIMDIRGVGNIDITVKGNRKDPHVWGILDLREVTTHFNEIPNLVLHNAWAVLNFNDEDAVFNLKQGKINHKDVAIDGTCNLSGKFDFDVNAENQELAYLHRAIKTSDMIEGLKQMVPEFDNISGLMHLKAKVYGSIKDIEDIKYNENFFVKGTINLLGNSLSYMGASLTSTTGIIDFEPTGAQGDINSKIGTSPIKANFKIKENFVDLTASIPALHVNDLFIKYPDFPRDMGNITVSVNTKYKGKIDTIEYDKVDFTAHVLNTGKNNKLKISNGTISLKNNSLKISDLYGHFVNTQSSFNINLTANNLSTKPLLYGKVVLKDFELPLINTFSKYKIIKTPAIEKLSQIRFDKGKINLNAFLNRNDIYASTNLGGIELTYMPLLMPIKIVNGSVYVKKDFIGLNKINLLTDGMPILIDGNISNIFNLPKLNLYLNLKPKQDFIDKYINNNRIYPLKIKGDIVTSAHLKGEKDNFHMLSEINMEPDSSIYHLGATIGDIENAIILNLNAQITNQNFLKIKEFSYDKLIASQGTRKTRLNMLKANGGIDVYKDDLIFHDLRIKTNHPTDARIFNIIFRKPNIKQGQFTSDLKFNGKLSNPKLTGNFRIFETNIPFLDTTLKSIKFVFKDKMIDIISNGEVFGNDIKIAGVMRNKLTPPYYVENASLNTKLVDINHINNSIKVSQLDEARNIETGESFDIKDVVIKNLDIKADNIKIRNLNAENVRAKISLNEQKDFNISDFKFYIANGFLQGNYIYNLSNYKTKIKVNASNIDANDISYAIFDLNNQIYGSLTGDMKLSCSGEDFNKCMETLSGDVKFNVSDGRMPKLGSLEYLLKAGNLIKGGLTGLSINSVIDIITPLKTGNFSNIYGDINIKDGVADNIEITTKGEDLSLFISGKYSFADSIADMEVLGLLSKKISTMFGPIGNVSLNTLFNVIPGVDLNDDAVIINKINKIPGIEFSDKSFRKFIAEIKGNINGDKYVSSFKWIN